MDRVDTTSRLSKLRSFMAQRNIDVYIIPSEDSHASEYTASCDARRTYISGFSGSDGCAVVTLDKAALATDGRYFNQASKQLDDNWLLLKQGLQDVQTWQEWAAEQSEGSKVVAVDPKLITGAAAKKLTEKIKRSGGQGLIALEQNLVDLTWDSARPPRPSCGVDVLPDQFAGKDVSTKIHELRQELAKKNCTGFFVSMLDEIAWLFNLRGSDILYNPVFFSYAMVTQDAAILYIDRSKLSDECEAHLSANHVSIKDYDAVFTDAHHMCQQIKTDTVDIPVQAKKFMISTKTSWALKTALGGDDLVDEVRSPLGDAKAVKNATEMDGMRACHVRDGAALITFFAWLEEQLVTKRNVLDEVAAADKLEELRAKQDEFVGLSFGTISSTGGNAAIIHYNPERGNCSIIDPNAIYLCDSGAQYRDGTTDTTRTLHFGQPTDMEMLAYAMVLKGHIALDTAIFPKGTTGFALDSLARQYLWKEGLDYRHGTGHGVGSFLNVHEGPIGIGTRIQYAEVPLAPGHVVSIEPGYYEDGVFGIRLENIAMVKEVQTAHSFGDKPYLGFEHVTVVPFCRKLIKPSLLSSKEIEWLNEYHATIFKKMGGFFQEDPLTLAWLTRETQPF